MKKIIFMIFAVLMLGLYTNAYAEKVICDENYEEYKTGEQPPGWDAQNSIENGTYYQVEEDPNDPSNKVLAFHNNGTDEVRNLFYFSEPIGGITTVTLRVRLGDSEQNVHWIAWMNECFNNMLYKKSFTMITSNGTKVMDNFVADFTKWYDIKYEIDFQSQTFSYYFDGMLIHDNIGFQKPDTNQITYMEFRLSKNVTYIDDLKITMEGGINKIYTKLSTNTESNYKYNSGGKTLQNVYNETTVENFMKHLEFVDGADVILCDVDGVTPYTGKYVKNEMKLVIESPDKRQRSVVTVYTRDRFFGTHTAKLAQKASCFAVDSEYVLNDNIRTQIDENNANIKCFYDNGEIYVPLRKLCECFEISVSWNPDKASAVLDGTKEVTGINKDGTVFIPSSRIEELTGKKILYNNNKLIVIRENDLIMRNTVRSSVMQELYKRLINE